MFAAGVLLALSAGPALAAQGEGEHLGEAYRGLVASDWVVPGSPEVDNLRGSVVVVDLINVPTDC